MDTISFRDRTPWCLLASCALFLLANSCRDRDGAAPPSPLPDTSARGIVPESRSLADRAPDPFSDEESDSCQRPVPANADSLIGTLSWPRSNPAPDLARILERSAQVIDIQRRINNQAGCHSGKPLSLRIPFEDSLLAWIHLYASRLAIPDLATPWPRQALQDFHPDSATLAALPIVPPSKFVGGKAVFLLGGTFLSKQLTEEGTAYSDLAGRREFRHSTRLDAASRQLVSVLRAIPGTSLRISYGPPLADYESGPFGIGGIGSLEHTANTTVRAWFLTSTGPVEARVVSVRQKLFEQDICISHAPEAVFGSKELPGDDIVAVYLPQDGLAPPRFSVAKSGKLTTLDFDGDGIPEFAAVVEPFEGIAGDQLVRAAWFVNELGVWHAIDAGSHEDCT
ncbi:MAG: hypothetical protein IPN71_07655 [Fibrobacteres bacterium]|nr:hypothetical protein [Fibrobacterota bacterium]